MELKTDDLKMISREDYRKAVEKIMNCEMKEATMSAVVCLIKRDEEITDEEVENMNGAIRSALKLQINVLQRMENELFGKEKEAEKEEQHDV